MQKILIGIALSAVTALACTNGASSNTAPDKTVERDTLAESKAIAPPTLADTTISGCYSSVVKRDTSNLQLDVKGTTATGPLSFNIYQKDRNDGTFQGEIGNGQIKGWYLFKSEGIISVREAIFKIKDKMLIPAVGEMVEKNDSSFFTNPSKLKFDESRAMVKVKCVV